MLCHILLASTLVTELQNDARIMQIIRFINIPPILPKKYWTKMRRSDDICGGFNGYFCFILFYRLVPLNRITVRFLHNVLWPSAMLITYLNTYIHVFNVRKNASVWWHNMRRSDDTKILGNIKNVYLVKYVTFRHK